VAKSRKIPVNRRGFLKGAATAAAGAAAIATHVPATHVEAAQGGGANAQAPPAIPATFALPPPTPANAASSGPALT
jgi:hypothetical protein